MPSRDPPAYFDGRHKRCIESGDGKADVTDERLIRAKLRCEEAKAVEIKVPLDAIHHFV
jgi:phage terminase Nu1 subunit (DNA packaging protein)